MGIQAYTRYGDFCVSLLPYILRLFYCYCKLLLNNCARLVLNLEVFCFLIVYTCEKIILACTVLD